MSAKTTTEYFCDRCGDSLGDAKPGASLAVRATLHGEWATEFDHKWDHFCGPCFDAVVKFFKGKPND